MSKSATETKLSRQRAPLDIAVGQEEYIRSTVTSSETTARTLRMLVQLVAAFCVMIAVSEVLSGVDGFAVKPHPDVDGVSEVASESAERYLLDHNEDALLRTRRKASTSSSKPATCTCTCETAVVATAPAPALASSGTGVEGKTENNEVKQSAAGKPAFAPPPSSSRLGEFAGQRLHQQQQPMHHQQQQAAAPSGGSQFNNAIESNKIDSSDVVSSDEPNKANELGYISDYEEAVGLHMTGRKTASQSGEQVIHDSDANDRYRGTYGQGSRHPWMRLPDRMCMRELCSTDSDCCRQWNICDRSAHICTDCWHGSPCTGPRHCCLKYPHCQMPPSVAGSAARPVLLPADNSATADMDLAPGAAGEVVGRCVDF